MRAIQALLLTLLLLLSASHEADAQARNNERSPRRVTAPSPPQASREFGCRLFEVPRNRLRQFEQKKADTEVVYVLLDGMFTGDMDHKENSTAQFAVSVRAPHSAMRYTTDGFIRSVHLCITGAANSDGVVMPSESLVYRFAAGFHSKETGLPRGYTGKLLLERAVAEAQPRVTTVLANGLELEGEWGIHPQRGRFVRLVPVAR